MFHNSKMFNLLKYLLLKNPKPISNFNQSNKKYLKKCNLKAINNNNMDSKFLKLKFKLKFVGLIKKNLMLKSLMPQLLMILQKCALIKLN